MTIDLYDSTIDQPEFSVGSSSESTDTSINPEIEHIEPIDDKPKFPEIIKSVNDEPEISPDLPANDKLKFSNKESYIQLKIYPSGYLTQEQQEAPTPNENTPESSQLINQEKDQSQWANIPQTNAQWLQQMDFLSALSYPAMIPPIDIIENRPDIYKKCQYTSKFFENLTDDRKQNQGRRRFREGFKFSNEQ
ncbi:24174_t:CDS:2, partial [Gigaspora margarita]